MGIALSDALAAAPAQAESVNVVEQITVDGITLAVCEVGPARTLTLMREGERGLFPGGESAPASEGDKRSREHGSERYWKRTASVADIARAITSGLLS